MRHCGSPLECAISLCPIASLCPWMWTCSRYTPTLTIWATCSKPGLPYPTGSRVWLIRIPNWDPAWQSIFEYASPVFLPKGSRIEMRYHYDNSAANIRNPNHPPKLVQAGNESVDEMAHLWLRVLPRGSGDRRRELEEAVLRHRNDKNPRDFNCQPQSGCCIGLTPERARSDHGPRNRACDRPPQLG